MDNSWIIDQCAEMTESLSSKVNMIAIQDCVGKNAGILRHGAFYPHLHDSWEVKYLVDAKNGRYVENGDDMSLPAIVVVPPRVTHFGVPRGWRGKLLAVMLDQNQFVIACRGAIGDGQLIVDDCQLAALEKAALTSPEIIFAKIYDAMSENDVAATKYAVQLLRFFFQALIRVFRRGDNMGVPAASRRDPVGDAIKYINANYYRADFTVGDIADHVGLSVNHLSVLFKRETGTTLRKELVDVRLKKASALLFDGGRSIKEISHLTGWRDQLYFSKCFRKAYGTPPSMIGVQ